MTKKTLSKTLLYSDNIIAITNRHLCSRPFMEQLERVCQLRPRAIVLREKDMPKADYLSLAHDVISLCKKYDILCILHSFIDVAIELEHPYIHMPLPVLEEYVELNKKGGSLTASDKIKLQRLKDFNKKMLSDSKESIKSIRENQREFFYEQLDKTFPGVKEKYIKTYGNDYFCYPLNNNLENVFKEECEKYGLFYRMEDIIKAYKKENSEQEQLTFI